MTLRLSIALSAAAFAALSVPTAIAHHGWGSYDEKTEMKLTGTITESSYGNPHATIKLKTADKTWLAWLAPIRRMEDRGLNKDLVKVGSTVTVVGYASTSVKDELRAERIIIGEKSTELR
jgi:Family of unknown function (DUF6152)